MMTHPSKTFIKVILFFALSVPAAFYLHPLSTGVIEGEGWHLAGAAAICFVLFGALPAAGKTFGAFPKPEKEYKLNGHQKLALMKLYHSATVASMLERFVLSCHAAADQEFLPSKNKIKAILESERHKYRAIVKQFPIPLMEEDMEIMYDTAIIDNDVTHLLRVAVDPNLPLDNKVAEFMVQTSERSETILREYRSYFEKRGWLHQYSE
ncbi:hypothetical protein ACFLQW_02485 [Candidatus Zixiibacteriota bacterium]